VQGNWTAYKETYDLTFTPVEEAHAHAVWRANMNTLAQNQDPNQPYSLGVTPFTHLTQEEFIRRSTLRIEPPHSFCWRVYTQLAAWATTLVAKWWRFFHGYIYDHVYEQCMVPKGEAYDAALNERVFHHYPEDLSWVAAGRISRVQDQQKEDSCWAFATTAVVEACIAIRDRAPPVELSTQQLVACLPHFRHGGSPAGALKWIIDNKGIASAAAYAALANATECQTNVTAAATITSYVSLDVDHSQGFVARFELMSGWEVGLDVMLTAVNRGPLIVLIRLDTFSFRDYTAGVITGCADSSHLTLNDLNHAVVIVGYGTTYNAAAPVTPIDYWLVRNSWGTQWGEQGYFRIARTLGAGQCGINLWVTYPVC
ncbi:Papain family cysteine protease, partial [uncultured virus]